ncbi:MAG: hypothetical protein Q9164_000504 [Protoblastenia rupestris]
MSSSHGRQISPTGRRIVSTGRTSTGNFANPSAYHDSSRTSREYVPGPRTSADRADGTRVVTVRQRSPPRRARDDDYEVRPRPRTLSLDPADPRSRRPLNLGIPKAENKSTRPIITKEVEGHSSPLSKTGGAQLEASYIMPASSSSGRHHHRQSSLTTGDRLVAKDRDRGERAYQSARSFIRPNPPKSAVDEHDYAYEYATPRDEVLRDLAPRPRARRDSDNRPRPTSMINLDRSDKIYVRTDRDAPPPASTRGFDNVGRSESLRQSTRPRDSDLGRKDSGARGYKRDDRDDPRYRDIPRSHAAPRDEYVPYPEENSRRQRARKPTLEEERPPQKLRDSLDERYGRGEDRSRRHHPHHSELDHRKDYNVRDDRDRRQDYDDKDRRVRDEPPERRDRGEEVELNGGLIAGAGTAAAAGLAAEGARRHRHKDDDIRSSKDSIGYLRHPDQASESTSISGDTRLSRDHTDEDREERRRRRRREREREDRDYREAREESQRRAQDPTLARAETGQQLALVPPTDQSLREQASYERRSDATIENPRRRHRHHRDRRHHPRSHTSDSYSDPSSSSSDDSGASSHHSPRQAPLVVTPPLDHTSETTPKPPAPPKSILKPPREKFPEEPSTVREGVAPLDAVKKGIPPEARWTRVNRRLVNPEALEMEGVRFEEFPDHVIVLKVLSQEEIARYTKLTHEIRERRRLGQGDGGSGSGSGTGGVGASEGGP